MRQTDELWVLIEKVVAGMGYDLVEIEHQSHIRNGLLRVYIDIEGGVNIDDCTQVSHQLSAMLDVEDPIAGNYDLEVSSPGIDRPVRTLEDFKRFDGYWIKLNTNVAIDGRRKFTGQYVCLDDETIQLVIDREMYAIPIGNIGKARLVADSNNAHGVTRQ